MDWKGDAFYALSWWLSTIGLSCVALPWVNRFANVLWDKGYWLSRILGMVIPAYLVWLLVSFHLLPFTQQTILGVISLNGLWLLWHKKGWAYLKALWKQNARIFLFQEALFLGMFAFWILLRGIAPDIISTTEKIPDFGLLNTLMNSRYFPIPDFWYAGESVNYYYWGHYLTAFLTKLTQIPTAITYNLMMASLVAWVFVLATTLGASLLQITGYKWIKALSGGLVSSLLIVFGANLHPFLFAVIRPWAIQNGWHPGPAASYWYPQATRYVGYFPETHDKTIHEFPSYSFVLSDLHAQVLGLPILLTNLLVLFCALKQPTTPLGWFKLSPLLLLSSFLLALSAMTNPWDTPLLFLFTCAIVFFQHSSACTRKRDVFFQTSQVMFQYGLCAFIFILPFWLHFTPFANGLFWVHSQTPLKQFLVLWGYQYFFALVFIGLLFVTARRFCAVNQGHTCLSRFNSFFQARSGDYFALCLFLAGLVCTLVPEVIYIKDVVGEDYYRSNTMFKFTFIGFSLFSLAIGYALFQSGRLIQEIAPKFKLAYRILALAFIAAALVYPKWAISGYYGDVSLSRYRGLDGTLFLSAAQPAQALAIDWLKRNTQTPTVITEAQGNSFSYYGIISAYTGNTTPIGWFQHEWLYRQGPEGPTTRSNDIRVLYEAPDIQAKQTVVDKYHVQYIVISDVEHKTYPQLNEAEILKLGQLVFERPQIKIIAVNPAS